jgi:DNA-binding transcriptional MerR regulator
MTAVPVDLNVDLALYLDALFAAKHAEFGDARMEDDAEDKPEEDEEDAEDAPEGDDKPEGEEDGDKPLGPKGEKAYLAEKEKRRAAQQELREWKAFGFKPEEIKKLLDGRDDADKPDPEKIREQAKQEARSEIQRERVMDKIEAKAGSRFSLDAEDVAALLMRRHQIDDFLDGDKIDAEAIQDALDELLDKQPGLGAQGTKKFSGSADGGTRKESRPAQLTEADVKRLSAEGKHGEIEKARKDGRLNDLLGIKASA